MDEENKSNNEPQPIGCGAFGSIYDQFRGKANEAVRFLMKIKNGEALAALHHDEIGDVSIVYGNEKAGLEKIVSKHPDVIFKLQEMFDEMKVVSKSINRIKLESQLYFAVVSRDFENEPRSPWLLTAFEKQNSVPGNTMDTDETLQGERNDTATPLNTVS